MRTDDSAGSPYRVAITILYHATDRLNHIKLKTYSVKCAGGDLFQWIGLFVVVVTRILYRYMDLMPSVFYIFAIAFASRVPTNKKQPVLPYLMMFLHVVCPDKGI